MINDHSKMCKSMIEFKPRVRFTGESEERRWVEDAADVELDDRREDGVGRRRRPVAVHFARHRTSNFWLSFFLICFLFLSFVFLNWFGGRRSLTTTLTATGSTRDWLKLFCWDEDYSVASKLSVSLKFCFTLWEKKERERHGTDSGDKEWKKDEREQTGKKKLVRHR